MKTEHEFWRFQNQSDSVPELILYGDISDRSWFGDEITPAKFADELKQLGKISELRVRINSGGGDVFAAQAIGNLLEHCGAVVTAQIDGFCASAATIIACHCSRVVAANDSTYMIHPVRMGIFDFVSAEEIEQYASALAAIRENIISLYARKTGREKEEVAAQMDATSWWTGAQAKEQGFVDELTGDDTGTVVENKNGMLFVNHISMNMPFDKAPKFVQDSLAAAPAAGRFVDSSTGKPAEEGQKEDTMGETINTTDELRNAYPELVLQIEQAAANQAAEAERSRIREIEDMALPGSEQITNDAKFVKPVSANEYAVMAMKHVKSEGSRFLQNAADDSKESGVKLVGNSSSGWSDEFMDALKKAGRKE